MANCFVVFDKKNGGHHVMAGQDLYFVAGGAYSMESGQRVSNENPRMVDREVQRPVEQWWLDVRPIARLLAQPAAQADRLCAEET